MKNTFAVYNLKQQADIVFKFWLSEGSFVSQYFITFIGKNTLQKTTLDIWSFHIYIFFLFIFDV